MMSSFLRTLSAWTVLSAVALLPVVTLVGCGPNDAQVYDDGGIQPQPLGETIAAMRGPLQHMNEAGQIDSAMAGVGRAMNRIESPEVDAKLRPQFEALLASRTPAAVKKSTQAMLDTLDELEATLPAETAAE